MPRRETKNMYFMDGTRIEILYSEDPRLPPTVTKYRHHDLGNGQFRWDPVTGPPSNWNRPVLKKGDQRGL